MNKKKGNSKIVQKKTVTHRFSLRSHDKLFIGFDKSLNFFAEHFLGDTTFFMKPYNHRVDINRGSLY